MDKLESYLKKIVDSLPHEGCLLKNGEILFANTLFSRSIDKDELFRFLERGDDSQIQLPYRSKDTLYSIKPIHLDEVYTLIFLSEASHVALVTDPLTGVLHRECFDRLSHQLVQEAVFLNRVLAFLFIDLDGFKGVNDTWGHENGDLVLKKTAERVSRVIRDKDFCFRVGGDEFVLILTEIRDRMHSCLVARRLISAVSAPIDINHEQQVAIGASIGIATCPSDGSKADELTHKADEAMYKAKKLGRNNYQLYSIG